MSRIRNFEYPGPDATFAELVEWHMQQGTRPYAGDSRGEWLRKQLAGELRIAESTLSRWLRGHSLPYTARPLARVMFNDSAQHQRFEKDLFEALARDRGDDREGDLEESYGLEDLPSLQSYLTATPLENDVYFIAYSLNVGYLHNQVRSIEHLLDSKTVKDSFSKADNLDDLLRYISVDFNEISISSIIQQIDDNHIVLYRASIHSADSSTIGKLPALIKGMAGLSSRQFRVGLFRLGATLVIICLCTGSGSYAGWEIARHLQVLARSALAQLADAPPARPHTTPH